MLKFLITDHNFPHHPTENYQKNTKNAPKTHKKPQKSAIFCNFYGQNRAHLPIFDPRNHHNYHHKNIQTATICATRFIIVITK